MCNFVRGFLGGLTNGGPYKHNVCLTEFKLTRTKKAQAIAALIKICTALINRINFNTFRKTTKKLTTQTKLEHNKKEVQTLISLKLVFASLIKIVMSNLQQRGFLLITKTRKAREVLISKGEGGR